MKHGSNTEETQELSVFFCVHPWLLFISLTPDA
jgi:hypothetical protein